MLRKLVMAGLGASLALGVMALPVAANGTAAVFDVQALPGRTVDVCSGKLEVISNFKYGKTAKNLEVPAGTHRIRVFVASKATCKGQKLIDTTVTLAAGDNKTFVYGLVGRKPGLRVFDNDVSLAAADVGSLTVRHVAKAPAIDVFVMQAVRLSDLGPTLEALGRGKGFGPFTVQDRYSQLLVFRSKDRRLLSLTGLKPLHAGKAHQAYFVGSGAKDYRVVLVSQPGIAP